MLRFIDPFEQAINNNIFEAEVKKPVASVPVGVDQECPDNYRRATKDTGQDSREKLPSCVKMSDKAIANKQSKKEKGTDDYGDGEGPDLDAELSDVSQELADARMAKKRDPVLIQRLKDRKESLLKLMRESYEYEEDYQEDWMQRHADEPPYEDWEITKIITAIMKEFKVKKSEALDMLNTYAKKFM